MIHGRVITSYSTGELVDKIDAIIGHPDNERSPGGRFLLNTAKTYVEHRSRFFGLTGDALNDAVTEVADSCLPVNLNDSWQIVADLELYRADFDLGEFTWENATQAVTGAVYETARLLIEALVADDERAVYDRAMEKR